MKKKTAFLATIFVLTIAASTGAEESKLDATIEENKLDVTIDATYVSRYIWRGFDSYPNNHSAIQPSINLDLYGTGFGVNIWWSRANRSGFENSEEVDYSLYYGKSIFDEKPYATDYTIGWTWFYYPDEPRKAADMQEVSLTLSWPNILRGGLIPCYTIVSTWPSESKSNISDYGGWFHIFGLCYDLTIQDFLAEANEQVFHLSAETIYNDGAYGAEHDWSHAVVGISTSFDLSSTLTFTPGFYYQSSWENSVNTQDEYWTSFSITYQF